MCAPDYKPFIACSKEKLQYSVQVNWTGKKCIIFCIAACLPGILETFIGKLLQTWSLCQIFLSFLKIFSEWSILIWI